MTEREAEEVEQAILSGWITTGPRTKKLKAMIANYVGVSGVSEFQKVPSCVCLNSATAAMEMVLHVLGVGPGDEANEAFIALLFSKAAEERGAITPMATEEVNRTDIKALYRPANDIQKKMGRIVVSNDCVHSFGA